MLPGFRFLFAAILLSTSVLIFGLGAAALLRAAHEEVASAPARRAPPEQLFTQQNEPVAPPTLALLRVEPPAVENLAESVAAAEAPAEEVRDTTPPVEPEKLTALKPDEATPPEAAKLEAAGTDLTPAAQTRTDQAEAPAPVEEVELVAAAEMPPASGAAPAVSEQAPAPAAPEQASATAPPEMSPAAATIATLGGPAVTIEETASPRTTAAKPVPSAVKKRTEIQRAELQRRKAAERARQAAIQQAADPFGLQPTITPATR